MKAKIVIMAALLWGCLLTMGVAGAETKHTLYVFTTPGCGPCEMFKRDYRTNASFRSRLDSQFNVVVTESYDLGKKYNVKYYPTFVVADKSGKALASGVGYNGTPAFIAFLNGIAKKVGGLFGMEPQQQLPPGLPQGIEGQDLGDRLKEGLGGMALQYGQQHLMQRQLEMEQQKRKDWSFWAVVIVGFVGYWYKNKRDKEAQELKLSNLLRQDSKPAPDAPTQEPKVEVRLKP